MLSLHDVAFGRDYKGLLMHYILSNCLAIAAAAAAASTALADSERAPLSSIVCHSTTAPRFDVSLDLQAAAPDANVTISSPGQIHTTARYRIQETTGTPGTRLAGLSWFIASLRSETPVSLFLHTYDVTSPGWGSLFYAGQNYDLVCQGVLAP